MPPTHRWTTPTYAPLATADPQGFVEGRPGLFVIDEIQRAPELLLAIKSSVDRQPRPGRFLITGSSPLSANRAVSETLAGRRGRADRRRLRAHRAAAPAAVRDLVSLRDRLGTRFVVGVVLHSGSEGARLGDRIISLPISALWT